MFTLLSCLLLLLVLPTPWYTKCFLPLLDHLGIWMKRRYRSITFFGHVSIIGTNDWNSSPPLMVWEHVICQLCFQRTDRAMGCGSMKLIRRQPSTSWRPCLPLGLDPFRSLRGDEAETLEELPFSWHAGHSLTQFSSSKVSFRGTSVHFINATFWGQICLLHDIYLNKPRFF